MTGVHGLAQTRRRDRVHHTTMRGRRGTERVRRLLAAALLAATPLACRGGDGPAEPTTPIGGYALATVNGRPLPAAVYSDPDYRVEITSGSLDLEAAGRFVAVMHTRETVAGHVSVYVDSTTGTWTQAASGSLQLTDAADGSTQTMTWAGRRITAVLSDGSTEWTVVYSRR